MIIKLTQGKEVVIDDQDFELLSKYKWRYGFGGQGGEFAMTGSSKAIRMHRLILGAKEGETVDHINGNGLDNRRVNLRIISIADNNKNKALYKNNRLGLKGVRWDRGKYEARIALNGKRITLGRFSLLQEAIDAYKKAEIKYFGEFARKNGGKANPDTE